METKLNKESKAAIELMISDGIITQEVAEKYFPELAESKDEKIRKWIIDYFENIILNTGVIVEKSACKNAIAWLEKQGKNNMGISESTEKKLVDNLNKALEKETSESLNEFLDEQGEQKPAEWIQELESKLSNATPEQLAEWKEKYFKVEPAWSEEDEVKINRIVACLENLNVADNDILLKDVDWLKSLKDRVQPKQEWGEEDEATFTVIGSLILDNFSAEDASKTLTWLHSLRPQSTWKPSEKQMFVLELVVNQIPDKEYEIIMRDLISDLKKLKD